MPAHDYQCHNCRNSFEHFCSIDQLDDPVICACGEVVQRVFRVSRIKIKTPFYIDLPQDVVDSVYQGTEDTKKTAAKVDLGKFGKDSLEDLQG